MPHRVAFLGFSEVERQALASHFHRAHQRSTAYQQVPTLTDAEFLVADADHGPSVQLVQAIERVNETVFIGQQAPDGCSMCLPRPVDAPQVMHELDSLVAQALKARAHRDDYAGPNNTIVQLARQRLAEPTVPPSPEPPALTLRDPVPAAPTDAATAAQASAAMGSAAMGTPVGLPPGVDLVAHEPPLPVTRGPDPEADWLPALQAKPQPAPAAAAAPETPPKAKSPRPPKKTRGPPVPAMPRVLLVDDSAIALRFLEVRLGAWQLDVDRAATSQAAMALLAQHSYDIVFLDIELGQASELDGLNLCQRIKHTPALLGAMVVLISAHHSELDRVRGALAGCDAYLAKPLDMRELQRLMQRQGVHAASSKGAAAP